MKDCSLCWFGECRCKRSTVNGIGVRTGLDDEWYAPVSEIDGIGSQWMGDQVGVVTALMAECDAAHGRITHLESLVADLTNRLAYHGRGKTHWAGCESEHVDCALLARADARADDGPATFVERHPPLADRLRDALAEACLCLEESPRVSHRSVGLRARALLDNTKKGGE